MGIHREEPTVPSRSNAEPVTPYVGKRALRAETPVKSTAPAESSAYVGKRALRAQTPSPATTPTPVAVVPVASVAMLESPAPVETTRVPSPRLAAVAVETPEVTDGWELFAAESPEDTGALPYALTEDFTGSLPKITDEMLYGAPGTDFATETTVILPAAQTGKRRAAAAPRSSVLRKIPSLPSLVGAAALTIAGIGAATTSGVTPIELAASPTQQAGAMSGTSAVAVVGSAREASLSRSEDRSSNPEDAAAAMAKAVTKLQAAADAQADRRAANQWALPMASGTYRLTARFGDSGLWANRHTGLDMAGPTGTPIRAAANGVITSMQREGSYGNLTVQTLEDGTELWYAHQSGYAVSTGANVVAGQVIGYVGSTGNVTGPHLHFEVRPGGGDPVDPFSAMVAQGVQP